MSDKLDDWPTRIAIPMLKEQLRVLEFIAGCFSDSPTQKRARVLIRGAAANVRTVIDTLEDA